MTPPQTTNPDQWRSRQFEFFDVLASLNKALALSPDSSDSTPLFKILKTHIEPLFSFETYFFVVPNPETFEFEITLCDPPDSLPLAQKALDFTINDNTFAWSLKQNRAVTLRCEPLHKSLVLHSVATPDHRYGMLIGVTRLGGIHEMDFTLPMISAIIQRVAYALERQKMSEKIRQTKMEAIGLIAGGIAHNFNNVLQSIQGNISLAQIEVGPSSHASLYLLQALESCRRAGLLSNQLLTFSKGGAPIRKKFSLRNLLELLFLDIHKNFSIIPSLLNPQEDPWIEADEAQMHHAFTQLLVNAAEANAPQGKIEVSYHFHEITSETISPLPPGKYWKIEINDHGSGIPEENLSQCLEPYFSTKPHHTGLGLTTAFSVIKSHGGHLEIRSVRGKGTSIQIDLPVSNEKGTAIPPQQNIPAKSEKTSLRILHMDDEESLRKILSTILRRNDYEIVSTKDGNEAIEAYQKSIQENKKFDWVILDLMIPGGMGGAETIQRLKEIDPHVHAIVCSGYSNDPIMSKPHEYGFQAVLKKPFPFQELLDLLKLHKK